MILQIPLAEIEPLLPYILLAFILISVMIGLYIYFGFNFFNKGIKSDNDAQKSYYKGLGIFIVTVAVSESLYLFDYIFRVLYNTRLFSETDDYGLGYEIVSAFSKDYYIAIFMTLSFGLIFLTRPIEKYLLGRKRKPLSYAAILTFPMPIIARMLEVYLPTIVGEYDSDSIFYIIPTSLWIINVGVLALTMLILLSLYLKMGIAAPPGSKLRKKSRFIVVGLIIWVFAILSTASILRSIWDSSYITNLAGPLGWWFIILPYFIPFSLAISLAMVSYGFTREY